jgi:hypothetical protein
LPHQSVIGALLLPSPALFDISHLLSLPCHCKHVLDSVINRH